MIFKGNLSKKIVVSICIFLLFASAIAGVSAYFITKHTPNQPALAASAELIENGQINNSAAKSLYNNHTKGTTFNLCGQEYKVVYINGDIVTAWATGYVTLMAFDNATATYKGSDVENYLVNTYYPQMCGYGGDITNFLNLLIVPASQTSGNGAFDSARIWLPSYDEVCNGGTWGFSGDVDRKTALGNESSVAWLRSYSSETRASRVSAAGVLDYGLCSNPRGVRPAFSFSVTSLNSLIGVIVTLDKAGGAGGSDTIKANEGLAMPASVSVPSKTGYNFAGYYTLPNGAGEQYYLPSGASSGKTYPTSGGPTTLYAYWTPAEYTLNFNSNGGDTPSPAFKKVNYNTAYGALANATRAGYNFLGWYTDPTAGTKIEESTIYTSLGDSMVYAHWSGVTFGVAYNPNKPAGASNAVSGSMTNSSHTYGTSSILKSNAFTLTGWTFAGWATSPAGGVAYQNNADATTLITSSTTVNLYAVWTANTYTIIYDGNGATGGATGASSHTYDTPAALTPNGFTRTNSSFLGWATSAGGAVAYANGQNVVNLATTGNVTLYAAWEAIKYNIAINLPVGGNVVFAANNVITTETRLPLNSAMKFWAAPNKGYAFMGWRVTGISISADALDKNLLEFSLTNSVTIEPIFADSLVKGVYVAATYGGKASVIGDNLDNLAPTDKVTFTTIPVLTGYEFVGWYDQNNKLLGSEDSIRLDYALVKDKLVTARYQKVSNDLVEDTVDNDK